MRALISICSLFRSMSKTRTAYCSGYKPCQQSSEEILSALDEEIHKLRSVFPELAHCDFDHEMAEAIRQGTIKLHCRAERWGLLPHWQIIGDNYFVALRKALSALNEEKEEKFYDYVIEQDLLWYLQQSQRSKEAIDKIKYEQRNSGVLIFAYQFGALHTGKASCVELEPAEFPLDPFSVVCLLITHPERLKSENDLWVSCPGAVCTVIDKPYTTLFKVDGDLEFDVIPTDQPVDCSGPATGFLPQ